MELTNDLNEKWREQSDIERAVPQEIERVTAGKRTGAHFTIELDSGSKVECRHIGMEDLFLLRWFSRRFNHIEFLLVPLRVVQEVFEQAVEGEQTSAVRWVLYREGDYEKYGVPFLNHPEKWM